MPKKALTHLYHLQHTPDPIQIGENRSESHNRLELFDKSLPLTSDLKRLPYLLGLSLQITYDAHILQQLTASTITGLAVIGLLMNGTYDATDYQNGNDAIHDESVMRDIIGIVHGSWHRTDLIGEIAIDIQNFSWDFEGEKVLYDTLTLMTFLDTNLNVAVQLFNNTNVYIVASMEIDWKERSVKDIQEFIMEHIYARQGD